LHGGLKPKVRQKEVSRLSQKNNRRSGREAASYLRRAVNSKLELGTEVALRAVGEGDAPFGRGGAGTTVRGGGAQGAMKRNGRKDRGLPLSQGRGLREENEDKEWRQAKTLSG